MNFDKLRTWIYYFVYTWRFSLFSKRIFIFILLEFTNDSIFCSNNAVWTSKWIRFSKKISFKYFCLFLPKFFVFFSFILLFLFVGLLNFVIFFYRIDILFGFFFSLFFFRTSLFYFWIVKLLAFKFRNRIYRSEHNKIRLNATVYYRRLKLRIVLRTSLSSGHGKCITQTRTFMFHVPEAKQKRKQKQKHTLTGSIQYVPHAHNRIRLPLLPSPPLGRIHFGDFFFRFGRSNCNWLRIEYMAFFDQVEECSIITQGSEMLYTVNSLRSVISFRGLLFFFFLYVC